MDIESPRAICIVRKRMPENCIYGRRIFSWSSEVPSTPKHFSKQCDFSLKSHLYVVTRIMFFFKAIWLCMAFSLCFALQEEGNCVYKAFVSKTCLKRGCLGRCCLGTACEVSYNVDGKWASSVEQSSSIRQCSSLCSKHYDTCTSKCECLVSRETIKDRGSCTCTPNNLREVLSSCSSACVSARGSCLSSCITSRSCAVAKTSVAWNFSTPGTCNNSMCPRNVATVAPLAESPEPNF